jgi:cell wall-associated NlpC family hydrolase
VKHLILPGIAALTLAGASPALAAGSTGTPGTAGGTGVAPPTPGTTGGAGVSAPPPAPSTPAHPTVPGYTARIVGGVAYAPALAPNQVKRAIWAGNQIRRKPYIWGGGHQAFKAAGSDCSGSVSFVLHAAGLLTTPFDSSDFMSWGTGGLGAWITVYTNPGHAFVEIAGIRFDTSAEADPHPAKGSGPRWRPLFLHPAGFMARHPLGF